MKVKLREDYSLSENVIEKILRMRGVKKKDVAKYLFPDDSMAADVSKLVNIEEGLELLHTHLQKESKLLIVIDSDLDGYSSASIMYQYIIKDLGYPEELVEYYIHEGKIHGIPESYILETKPDLVIVPDAGTNEHSIHKTLYEAGISTLVIDHHLSEKEELSDYAVVINNQTSPDFKHKGLTGANMVYLFCEAFDKKYMENQGIEEYLSLAAIGSIADRAPLTDKSVYYYLQKGGKNVTNPLIKKIVESSRNIDSSKPLTPRDISWSISPMVNSIVRMGKPEDIQMVVDAIMGKDYKVYNSRLKDEFSVVDESIRKMNNARNLQSRKTKEAMELLEERIEEMGTAENQVLLVNATGIIEQASLTGLVATKLAEKYHRPTLVLRYNEHTNMLTGSGRNFANSNLENFKDELQKSGVFEYALGHQSALGCGLHLDNASNVIDILNEQLADVEYDNLTYEVDLQYSQKPDAHDILEIAQHDFLWGNDLDSPLVHVEDIYLPKSDIKFIGQKGNVWKLDLQTCDAILFNMSDEQKLHLTNHEEDLIKISIVGECSVNTYNGQNRAQILIKDFEAQGISDEQRDPWVGFDVNVLPF